MYFGLYFNNFFLSSSGVPAKFRGQYRNFPSALCLHTFIASPIISVHLWRGSSVTVDEPDDYRYIIINKSPLLALEFALSIVHPMDLKKCLITCIHHCGITKSIFTNYPEKSSVLHLLISLNLQQQNFIVSIILSFTECCLFEII